ncbi:SGNH/GDSL hydrolase family protein [candidate division CSSED10-310 bacterium]|uniref:SGNH/GDSL hydrolase family protein n=1 Tax=candidate division CSSED10-310 bacterium TaxID=2855610 RepID=A0ABV6Z201_UNCC1
MKKNILLVIASITVTLFVFETIFRIISDNQEWWIENRASDPYVYPINKYSFRDFDYEQEKSPGTVRIACIGDSFTWGAGVKFDDSFPKRLERTMNVLLRPDTGKKYEVMNFSWFGSSTFQQVNRLESIKEFQPDMIVLGYCLNDAEDWTDKKGVYALRKKFIPPKIPGKTVQLLCRHSALISFISKRILNSLITNGTTRYYQYTYEDSYSGWQRTSEAFKILSEQEVPVIVLIFPLLSYEFNKYPFLNVHEKIRAELEKHHLPYIDYYHFFRQENYLRLQAIPFINAHPSEIACRIIEEKLYQKLKKEYKTLICAKITAEDTELTEEK